MLSRQTVFNLPVLLLQVWARGQQETFSPLAAQGPLFGKIKVLLLFLEHREGAIENPHYPRRIDMGVGVLDLAKIGCLVKCEFHLFIF